MSRPDRSSPARPMKVRNSAFDLHKTGVSRFDLRDPYHFAVTLSWPGFMAGTFGALLGLNAIFAVLYTAEPGAVQNLKAGDLLRGFFFSLETLATVGYGEMAPDSVYGHVVAGIEIVIGMAFTAIFTGLLFVRFSKPRSKILFADKAVVTPHNGTPTLMVRIANGRLTMLTHATARLAMLILEVSSEGQSFRRVVDLKLERDALPIFPLTWTLMHVIDDASPLAGFGPDELKAHEIRIFVTVEALDTVLGAQVQDISAYENHHVAFGVRYADAVSFDDGRVTADLARLSLVE